MPPFAETMAVPLSADQIERECRALIAAGSKQGVEFRLIGGLAVRVHCSRLREDVRRDYRDLDLVTTGKLPAVIPIFDGLGYAPHKRFNALHGPSRAIFYGPDEGLKADVFLGGFRMCHELPLTERLDVEELTVPLAELCLTKLQIVRLNEKDLHDLYALLAEHPVADRDDDAINGDRIAYVCSTDWGLYHTVELNLHRLEREIGRAQLAPADRELARRRAADLLRRIELREKSRKWRLRARVGERMRWYEDPDEVVDAR